MKFNNLMNQKKYTISASDGPVATASASFSTWGGGGEWDGGSFLASGGGGKGGGGGLGAGCAKEHFMRVEILS